MTRTRLTPHQRRLAGGAIFTALFGVLALVVWLGTVLGAGFGEPCAPGVFSCRNMSFNDARCLTVDDASGYCTRLCATDDDCPEGAVCGDAQWSAGPRDRGSGRVEGVCLLASP